MFVAFRPTLYVCVCVWKCVRVCVYVCVCVSECVYELIYEFGFWIMRRGVLDWSESGMVKVRRC